MLIMNPRTVTYMSAIIAVCGRGVCLMISDSRKMVNVGGKDPVWEFHDDATQKIFKINSNILFGGVGRFWKKNDHEEEITSPFANAGNVQSMSVFHAADAVERYMADNIRMVDVYPRKYLLAGREHDGNLAMISIDYDAGKCEVRRSVFRPRSDVEFATLMALPRSLTLSGLEKVAKERLEDIIHNAESVDNIILRSAELIRWIGENDIDASVGGNVNFLTI